METKMASKLQLTVVEEIPGALKLYSDGSIARPVDDVIINIPPCAQPLEENYRVVSRDVQWDHRHSDRWVRLYLPDRTGCTACLPIMFYFHGGGFCFLSPAFVDAHRFCLKLAAALGVIIVSVNYRLAPEHRLPAAYDDSLAAMEWVQAESIKKRNGEALDPWLDSFADFSNVFLMGDSAGGNIVHHLIMNVGESDGCNPERIRGALLLQPAFGGEECTKSEIECSESAFLTWKSADTLIRLSLPTGANKDHPFSNPFCSESPSMSKIAFPPLLVSVGGKDCMRDRDLEYCEALKKYGHRVEMIFFEEEEHAFHSLKMDSENTKKLMERAALFIASNSDSHCCGTYS